MKPLRMLSTLALAILVSMSLPASSQELLNTKGEYQSPSIKVGWNSRVGDLVEVSFKVVREPAGGIMSQAGINDILALCKTVAAEKLAAYYRDYAAAPLPYYAITINSGENIALYARIYFETDGDCTPVRISSLGS